MPTTEMKGITVKIPADLHAEVKAYLEAKALTMGDFITLAVENELHPQIQIKEDTPMQDTRTMAFQIPEDLFQRVKSYLKRNNMTQKQFVLGLVEDELQRDEALHQDNGSTSGVSENAEIEAPEESLPAEDDSSPLQSDTEDDETEAPEESSPAEDDSSPLEHDTEDDEIEASEEAAPTEDDSSPLESDIEDDETDDFKDEDFDEESNEEDELSESDSPSQYGLSM